LTKRTGEGAPVHSFPTLLADLATLTPTPLQQRAFELLGVSPRV